MSDHLNKAVKSKKTFHEESFYLLNLLKNNACLRCINKSCKITEEHGINFPEKMSTFVQNPTYISEIGKVIESAKLDFSGKKPFYTICNYVHKKCRNCEDGRIKYVNYEDKQILLCYPFLDNIKNKVTVGVHIDIKLIMKGHKYEVSCIPLEVKFEKKNFAKNFDKHEEFEENNRNDVPSPFSDKTYVDVWDEEIANSNFTESNFSPEKCEENEWPLLSPKEIKKNDSFKDYSQLKKILSNETIDEMHVICDNTKKNFDTKSNFDLNPNPNFDTPKNFEKKEKKSISIELLNEEKEKENINYLKIIEKNKDLENEIILLKLENKKLKENLENSRNLMKNNKVYDEILYNINEINNRVTEDFLSTNYNEYLIF